MTKRADFEMKTRALCLKPGVLSAKMTRRADLGLKMLFCKTHGLCWNSLKSGGPSEELTKRADLGLNRLFSTNSCTFVEMAKKWFAECGNDKTC